MTTKGAIYIVEDEAISRASLEAIVEDAGYDLAGSAADAEIALKAIQDSKPTVILLDINLGADKDGIWLAEQLRIQGLKTNIIYLTAYGDKETLLRIKKTKPKAYLRKPFDETTLCTTIDLIMAQQNENLPASVVEEYLLIQDGRKKIRLELGKLIYVQSDGNYVRLGLTDATYFIRASLKWYIQNLSASTFVQIHRSTLINKRYVLSADNYTIQAQNLSFKVGNSFRPNLGKLL